MSEKRRGSTINILRKTGHARENAHQQKERYCGKICAGQDIRRLLGEKRKGRHPAATLQRETDDPDCHHGKADGYLKQDQCEQCGDSERAYQCRLQSLLPDASVNRYRYIIAIIAACRPYNDNDLQQRADPENERDGGPHRRRRNPQHPRSCTGCVRLVR